MKGPTEAELKAAQESKIRQAAINESTQNQNGFFNLRFQLLNTLILQEGNSSVTTDEMFRHAHVMARLEFMNRYESAKKLIEVMGEVCHPSPLYEMLKAELELQ